MSQRPLVLVIDDEEDFRNLLALGLSLHGYEVITASSGYQGVQLATARRPSVITCDIKMPGVDGVATITALHRAVPNTPLVVVTGFLSDETIEACNANGAVAYLRKPFTIEELCAVLDQHRP